MKFKRSGIFIVVMLCSGIMLIPNSFTSKVYAAVKSLVMQQDSVVNTFSAGVKIAVDEGDFTNQNSWQGQQITKQVSIPNNGSTPAFVRVAIIPRWIDEDGNPWPGDVSEDVVEIGYANSSEWIDGGDGYYYYNRILNGAVENQDGTKTIDKTSNIIEYVELNTNNIDVDKYYGKTLIVDVNAEAIEASQEAYTAAWPSINDTIKGKLNALLKPTTSGS